MIDDDRLRAHITLRQGDGTGCDLEMRRGLQLSPHGDDGAAADSEIYVPRVEKKTDESKFPRSFPGERHPLNYINK